jgi:3D (Asp-Asp-Asp) domain-containing protein
MEAVSSPLGFVSRRLTRRGRKRLGTVAADTTHRPVGTRRRVPGWGDGVVEDRGGAIKGAGRLDLFHGSHAAALRYGRRDAHVGRLGWARPRAA